MFFAALCIAPLAAQDPAPLEPPADVPLEVTADTRLAPGVWLRPAPPDGEAVLVLRGLRGVSLDLEGAELRGAPADADLDGLRGFGVLVEDCADVTVRGGRLGGFRGCVVARRSSGLVLEDLTFDGWFGQRLKSTPAAEDPSDWLWPHENDAGEWLASYGAAISLEDCEGFTVRRCRGRRGQNGILLTRSNGGRVYDCDFSFLSGWGLALYRASGNTLCRNVLDYCVRGYSDGVYWRGQDSAGILMFERCCDNVVALNSATHGGDGVFLFAGQDLVAGRARERGERDVGGSDRNLFWRNDVSYAVANALEMTFSRGNVVIENRARGSHQHGLWGGYSSRLLARGNDFSGTRGGGITVEHGQECAFEGNRLEGCRTGLELYWDPDPELVQGPLGEQRDTDSRDHWIAGNRFADNGRDLRIEGTRGVRFGANLYAPGSGDEASGAAPGPTLEGVDSGGRDPAEVLADAAGRLPSGLVRDSEIALVLAHAPPDWWRSLRLPRPAELPGDQVAWRPEEDAGGLDTIVMGEWGPWDFRSGAPRPAVRIPGGLLAGAVWDAVWFDWKERADPQVDADAWRALAEGARETGTVAAWLDPWGGDRERAARVGRESFGLRATCTLELEGGRYALTATSDDGLRVSVDGAPVLEHWEWHAPATDRVELQLSAGTHDLALEYYQIQGAVALSLALERLGP